MAIPRSEFQPGFSAGLFFFYKIPTTTRGSPSCDLPCLRFHRVLDLYPTSNGRPAVFARYDGLTSQIIGNVEPTAAFPAFEASVRIGSFGQRSLRSVYYALLVTLSRAARRIAKSGG
jgi:hypothetical protein